PLTGAALNPARGFALALVGGEWGGVLAWLIGPVLGGVLAWTVHEYVLAPQPEVPAEQP
ncbi:MAG: aquaporin, partial [Actinobacteria bacterium]|nr:aquaporin [Actinomycetota bacterium]NIS35038.1 aquaporin [Actinomycetota bacterium]NIU69765.1 aquaporin [Actinomycetota bacterium]NIW31637.1 aquaporin [Actinomycetota bacterium]NIX23960.1 aquaporin [Actinomycetota bacterium]